MARVIVCLGGAWNVWQDFEEAQRLCREAGVDYDVGAVNDAGAAYRGRLTLWCTLHPEKLRDQKPRWQRQREAKGRNTDYMMVANKGRANTRVDKIVAEIWGGSSGLYIAQIAAIDLDYDRIVLCGIPMTEEGHFFDNNPWRHTPTYRRGWREAKDQPELAGKVRSLSGWTRDVLGAPDPLWLQAVPGRP